MKRRRDIYCALALLVSLPMGTASAVETAPPTAATVPATVAESRSLWVVPRRALPDRQFTILGFLYPDAWLVEASAAALRGSGAVLFENDRKTSAALRRFAKQSSGGASVAIEIVLHPDQSLDHFAATLTKLAPEVTLGDRLPGPPRRLIGRLPTAVLDGILELLQARPEVLWLDRHRRPQWLNADSVGPIQANLPSGPTATPIWDQGLVGTGQIIAIADSGLDRNEDWFSRYHNGAGINAQITTAAATTPPVAGPRFLGRKVVAYWVMPGASAYDDNQSCGPFEFGNAFHGTHVTGTAAGDGGQASQPGIANYDTGDGMAPHAKVLFQDLGNDQSGCLSGVGGAPMWAQARAGGARIHSNSYGATASGGYTASDAEVDGFLWGNEDMLIVFAAGNDGGSMTINHPGNAKHVLTVGALNHGSSTLPASFSSRGPTPDGRLKPDIAAPGVGIFSAAGNDNDTSPSTPLTKPFDGTSMATPAVAGAAALARQYFVDGFYPTGAALPDDALFPSGVLLKALLLNGTRRYPDTPAADTGWGRVWLDSNLYFPGDTRGLRVWSLPNDAGLSTGQSHQYRVQVAAGDELRATLVWYDPPPSLASSAALVNDLDLTVIDPNTNAFLGNVFAGGESTTGGIADALNPVEQVLLAAPVTGEYTVRVDAAGMLGNGQPESDRQGYALVVSAGRCLSAVSEAPDFTLDTDGAGVQIDVFDPVTGADRYQIYRARGSCTQNLARLQFAGATATNATTFLDLTTQGGFRYAYRVRAADNCGEGPLSGCQEIVSQAPCKLAPDFSAAAPDAVPLGSFCAVDLSWDPATGRCPGAGAESYEVHRSTDPFFAPEPMTRIDPGLATPGFSDYEAPPGVTHYYRVIARDGLGNAAPASAPAAYAAVATETMPGTYSDGGELLALADLQPPWRLTEQQVASGARSYHNAVDGLSYPANSCAALTTRPLPLQAGATLSYAARYDLESGWDGVVVEISTNGGLSWTDLPPAGGYPGDFLLTGDPPANACGYPASQGAFNADGGPAFITHSSDLSAWVGREVLIRWRFSSDPGVELEGFYLDDIQVSNAGEPLACAANELLFVGGFEGG